LYIENHATGFKNVQLRSDQLHFYWQGASQKYINSSLLKKASLPKYPRP